MTIQRIQNEWWVKTKIGAFKFNTLHQAIAFAIDFAKRYRKEISLSIL